LDWLVGGIGKPGGAANEPRRDPLPTAFQLESESELGLLSLFEGFSELLKFIDLLEGVSGEELGEGELLWAGWTSSDF
jgi:hypothetical protein